MKQVSRVSPAITIDYHQSAKGVASGYSLMLPDGRHYSPADVKRALSLTGRQMALLRAEALDLTWPLGTDRQLSTVTIKHDKGQYSTSFNAGAGRFGMVEYFYDNILYINLGLPGEDEDGTPCKVLEIVIGNETF